MKKFITLCSNDDLSSDSSLNKLPLINKPLVIYSIVKKIKLVSRLLRSKVEPKKCKSINRNDPKWSVVTDHIVLFLHWKYVHYLT